MVNGNSKAVCGGRDGAASERVVPESPQKRRSFTLTTQKELGASCMSAQEKIAAFVSSWQSKVDFAFSPP